MEENKLFFLGALAVLLIILAIIFFKSGGQEKIKDIPSTIPAESLSTEPQEGQKIVLFFLSEQDTLLHAEEREIVGSPSVANQAKQTIEELIRGSRNGNISPFSPEIKLRELLVTPGGIAYVDFPKEFHDKHLSGSSAEIATVFSIVNSLTYNFKSIKKVFILIEGGERETLRGHIDLSKPFLPRYNLIAN
ncbi:GerMN domain-containing protein [Acidobacteriota bacterium]